jgi:hypothetical protein
MPPTLAAAFDRAMEDLYRRARVEAGYNATLFLHMLHDRGGLGTARHLINADNPSEGYTRLFMAGRLDLTVEAVVVDEPRWHPLFTADELDKARRRLAVYGYGHR